MHVWVTNAVPPLHPSPCVAAARCRVLSKSPHTSFVVHECQRARHPRPHNPPPPSITESNLLPPSPPLPFPFTSTLTLTLCHAAGVISAQVQHSHRDAIREQQWQQRQREYDGEGDGGMKKRRGGAERWPERRRERKVQHKDKIHQFVVHIRKESGPFNRATDGPTFRKNKRRTFFFLPFFLFLTSALACSGEIRSSDKTQHVEGGRRFAGRNAASLVSAAGENGSSWQTKMWTNMQDDTHTDNIDTRPKWKRFLTIARTSVPVGW